MTRPFFFLFGATALLAAAACGSSGGSSTTGGNGGSGGDGGEGGQIDKILAPGECTQATPCTEKFETCGLPEDPLVCGNGAECADPQGSNCPAGWTCGPQCSCGGAGCHTFCKAPCAEAGCPTGETCQGDGSCVATTCSADSDCPDLFSCSSGACAPRPCEHDADCGAGYCVSGACHATPGKCAELAA